MTTQKCVRAAAHRTPFASVHGVVFFLCFNICPPLLAPTSTCSASRSLNPLPAYTSLGLSSTRRYETLKAKGNALTKAGDFEAAIACYDRCIELQPNEIAAINNRSLCNLRLGNWSAATRDAASVLAVEPANTKALLRRVKGLVGLGQLAEAEAHAVECLRLEPNNAACAELLKRIREELKSKAAGASDAQTPPATTTTTAAAAAAAAVPTPAGRESQRGDPNGAIAALQAQRDRLEAERRRAEDEVAKVRGKVDAAKVALSEMKATVAEKEAVIAQAAKTMRDAVPEIVADVLAQAQAEGDSALVAEATAAKKRVEATAAAAAVQAKKATTKAPSANTDAGTSTPAAAPAAAGTARSPVRAKTTDKAAAAVTSWTPTEFMKQLARLRRDPVALSAMLATVDGARLPKLFSNRLEASDITAIFRALAHASEPRAAHDVLSGLAKVQRFDMVGMFLEEADWEIVDPVFDRIKAAAASGAADGVVVADVEELRARFH
jgi:hypothetical protein